MPVLIYGYDYTYKLSQGYYYRTIHLFISYFATVLQFTMSFAIKNEQQVKTEISVNNYLLNCQVTCT